MQFKTFLPALTIMLLYISGLSAQQKPVISFKEKEFNFGTIKENEGIVGHKFEFTNQGNVPLIINDVKSSCGCTVPEWTKSPILPGKSGSVKVNFNPDRQSGAFNKTVQIISNAEVSNQVLVVRGVVVPADGVEEVYKFSIGNLRLQTIYAAFGEIYKGKTEKYTIKVFNNSDSIPAMLSFRKIPGHLNVRIVPQTIEPKQGGIIEIEYLTENTNSWDYIVDRLDLIINGKTLPNNRVNVTANIKEDFSALTPEQLSLAPSVEFDNQQHDFGIINGNTSVEHSFKLVNTGKSNLYIRKVSASCGCTAVQPEKTTISPGDSTLIKAIFNSRGREGNQRKAITVITNDPKKARSILWINAIVQKEAAGSATKVN